MEQCGWEISDWITALAAIGTLVLALAAIFQGNQTRNQIKLSKRQADSGEAAAKAAIDAYKEALKTRVDQTAPRVVAFFEPPSGPYFDSSRSGMPYANERRLLDAQSKEQADPTTGRELAFPEDGSALIWYSGFGLVVNEGESSAVVRLDGESKFVTGNSPLDGSPVEMPYLANREIFPEAILPPGKSAMFEWAAGRQAIDWAEAVKHTDPPHPYRDVWINIIVFDAQHTAIIDTLEAVFSPNPLSTSASREGLWKLEPIDPGNRIHVLPVTRDYVAEGAKTDNPRHQREQSRLFVESKKDD